MLTCVFIAGHLILSNGKASIPIESVSLIEQTRQQIKISGPDQSYAMDADLPPNKDHLQAIRDCAREAETQILKELEGE